MDKVAGRLTVFFEEPFWVGVFERMPGNSGRQRSSGSLNGNSRNGKRGIGAGKTALMPALFRQAGDKRALDG